MTVPLRLTMIHIPKTGGNTMWSLLRRCFDEQDVAPFLFQGKSVLPEKNAHRLIVGHIGFTMAHSFDAPMITVLREPIDRTISLFHFWRQQKVAAVPENMSLEDFLRSDHPGILFNTRNPQTWQIAHSMLLREQRLLKINDGALLARAFRNLATIKVVGITERLDDFTSRVATTFGLDFPPVERLNRSKRPLASEISEECRSLITERTRLDKLLYEYAVSLAI